MTMPHAPDIILVYDDNAVDLRPSLRAATYLERLHDGFPALLRRVQGFDLSTIRTIIETAATDRAAADSFLATIKNAPLAKVREAVTAQAFALLTALMMPSGKSPKTAEKETAAKPVAWSDLFADLYKIATGWLGWTPAQAWAATLTEIASAFDGLVEKLKAIHGTGDAETAETPIMTSEQQQANIDAGLDPDFDRAALNKLKQKIASKAANQ